MAVSVEERESWEREIAAWRASGRSMSAWARERGIARHRLKYWKRRLEGRETGRKEPLSLIPVAVSPAQVLSAARIEVVVERAGLRIVLPTDFEAESLARMLDVVESRC